jgi:threonylcarbamoyladenosine tRNA methylthiotransferase MtaB
VIVGFPGETEENFNHTYDLVNSLPFSYLHVFPFSRRKGTPASEFTRRVNEKEIKRRAEAMRGLGREKRQAFYRQFLDQELSVLVENREEKETGRGKGLSRNYIPVLLDDGNGAGNHRNGREGDNQECMVRVTGLSEKGVIGKVLEK